MCVCVWGGGVYSAVGQHHSHVYEQIMVKLVIYIDVKLLLIIAIIATYNIVHHFLSNKLITQASMAQLS